MSQYNKCRGTPSTLIPALAGVVMLALTACKAAGGFTGGAGKKQPASAPANPRKTEIFDLGAPASGKVDVAFFLDTSDSMKEELAALMGGLQRFADDLSDGSDGLDYQMFIVANSAKISASLRDAGRLDVRNSDVNSHSALWNAYHFLEGHTENVPSGSLSLRQDAVKEIVVLSDDDAKGVTAANFGPYLKNNIAKLGSVRVSGFVGLASSVQSPTCKVAAIGQSYVTLAADPAVGGLIADVCNSNWSALLGELAAQVKNRAGKNNVIVLKGRPINASSLSVKVDGQVFSAFTYDAATARVTLDPAKLAPGGHKVEVSYL